VEQSKPVQGGNHAMEGTNGERLSGKTNGARTEELRKRPWFVPEEVVDSFGEGTLPREVREDIAWHGPNVLVLDSPDGPRRIPHSDVEGTKTLIEGGLDALAARRAERDVNGSGASTNGS
jgi:hypothetical protein